MSIARLMTALLAVGFLLPGCEQAGFYCGLENADGVIQRCSGAGQLCICASYSCAAPVTDPESPCETKYQYVDFFGHKPAGSCVTNDELATAVDQVGSTVLCSPRVDTGADEPVDATAAPVNDAAVPDAYAY